MNLEKVLSLSKEAHQLAFEKGFWAGYIHIHRALILIRTELAEAIQSLRTDTDQGKYILATLSPKSLSDYSALKNTVWEELADTYLRTMDLIGRCLTYFRDGDDIQIEQGDARRLMDMMVENAEEMPLSVMLKETGVEGLLDCLMFLSYGIQPVVIDGKADTQAFCQQLLDYIALLDVASNLLGFQPERAIRWKMEYNKTRPKKHNKKW
jgi:hypothetical protein